MSFCKGSLVIGLLARAIAAHCAGEDMHETINELVTSESRWKPCVEYTGNGVPYTFESDSMKTM